MIYKYSIEAPRPAELNLWLHLYETAVHRADCPDAHTNRTARVGERGGEGRVETDCKMKEWKPVRACVGTEQGGALFTREISFG